MKQQTLNLLSELDNITELDYKNILHWVLFKYMDSENARAVVERLFILEVGSEELQLALDKFGINRVYNQKSTELYLNDYFEIQSSIEGEYMTQSQIKKRIAREWNLPIENIEALHNKAFNNK